MKMLVKKKADFETLDEEGIAPPGCLSDSTSCCIDLPWANGANMIAKNEKKLTEYSTPSFRRGKQYNCFGKGETQVE